MSVSSGPVDETVAHFPPKHFPTHRNSGRDSRRFAAILAPIVSRLIERTIESNLKLPSTFSSVLSLNHSTFERGQPEICANFVFNELRRYEGSHR